MISKTNFSAITFESETRLFFNERMKSGVCSYVALKKKRRIPVFAMGPWESDLNSRTRLLKCLFRPLFGHEEFLRAHILLEGARYLSILIRVSFQLGERMEGTNDEQIMTNPCTPMKNLYSYAFKLELEYLEDDSFFNSSIFSKI